MVNRPSSISKKSPFHCAVAKYGVSSFKKYILSFYDSYEEAIAEEKYIVNEDWVKSDRNYNIAIGGKGYGLKGYGIETISNLYRGEKNHRYGKPAHNRRRVLQYSLSGEFIMAHDSATDAAKHIHSNPTNIVGCCVGKSIQVNGFVFKYETYSVTDKERLNKNTRKRHRIYNEDGSWEMSQEHRNEKSGLMKGKKAPFEFTDEIRMKMSIAKLGKKRQPHSAETRIKIGNANKIAHLKKTGGLV